MKIAISGGKGGTGKSMVACNLAVELTKKFTTSLLDVDVECPNDHLLLNIKRKKHSNIYQPIPKFDLRKCQKCGRCAQVCKQNAIIFSKGKYPVFIKDACIGCKACIFTCPYGAIKESKKQIGSLYTGKNYNVNLISGELKLGQLASGEVVAEAKTIAEQIIKKLKTEILLIDSAAGIGCPVIASLTGADYIVAVTEPTPSALHDLKRVLYLADHFKIKHGIIINKYTLASKFCKKIENFARQKNIKIIGRLPFAHDFVKSTITMRPIVETHPQYQTLFQNIIKQILKNL